MAVCYKSAGVQRRDAAVCRNNKWMQQCAAIQPECWTDMQQCAAIVSGRNSVVQYNQSVVQTCSSVLQQYVDAAVCCNTTRVLYKHAAVCCNSKSMLQCAAILPECCIGYSSSAVKACSGVL